ncbi:MAG: sensor histidine kinase [Bdellovibrionota bacterium]
MYKRDEWQIQLRRHLKGFGISLAVALVFYLISIPRLHGLHEHVQFILVCALYGMVIYTSIWALYAIQYAILRKKENPAELSLPLHFFLSIGGCGIGLFLAGEIESRFTGDPFTFPKFWESFLLGIFIALMFQFYYAYKHSSQENLKLKAAKAEAELHALRNQMQPHFLFNSLNSLAALIDLDPAEAGEATQKLADLYRLILDCSKSTFSPLERELKIARLYLEVEKIRFGKRLNFLFPTLSPAEKNLPVPSLVIQTLVENAVKHGIAGSVEGGYVHISLIPQNGSLRVEILNSGAPLGSKRGNGTGLKNTEERLALGYGPRHEFRLSQNGEGLTCASFLIPEAI